MRIAVFCTLSTGLFSIERAMDLGLKIDKVIGLNPDLSINLDLVSGYVDIRSFCKKKKIHYKLVKDYSLKSENANLLLKNIDLIWVAGWQRLIPESFISIAKFGAIGVHGSCDGITKGRGRSPQNWALLIGAKIFDISLFKISNGVDDGSVIFSNTFKITDTDNILTSYIKSSICIAENIVSICKDPSILKNALPQKGEPSYFPKRIPSDGFIDWNMSVTDINNQVRALSHPYPNARTFYKDCEIYINKSTPILCKLSYDNGYVVKRFLDGKLLVSGKDGGLLLEDYTVKGEFNNISQGIRFKSVCMSKTVKQIINRFEKEFPNKPLNQSLVSFWKRKGIKTK